MDKRPTCPNSDDDSQPLKIRRIARACLQCRTRKQRCLPSSAAAGLQAPCKRCQQQRITCSFETDQLPGPDVSPSPSRMAQLIVDLRQRLNSHETRIAELERRESTLSSLTTQQGAEGDTFSGNSDTREPLVSSPSRIDNHVANDDQSTRFSYTDTPVSQSPGFSMDTLDLGPPIATLRSLGALTKDGPTSGSHVRDSSLPTSSNGVHRYFPCDPVSRGVLSIREAQRAIDIYFDHCHPLAPVLSEKLRRSGLDLRISSPTLFLAICSVGARFWDDNSSQSGPIHGLHPSFFDLTALLDVAVSRLLLRPTPSDVTLDSISLLLLYVQWMPCSQEGEDGDVSRKPDSRRPPKSRYNDISAWAVLGLAVRYALFLGLDKTAIAPFQGPAESITEGDISRLRVWLNLLTCDYNLMLTSGLPASLDPAPAAGVARVFGSHCAAQQPGDLRVTALLELVVIAHRANRSSGDFSGQLDGVCLRKANTELDEWERSWVVRLRNTDSQHNQLPFTSVRWYRLALNSAPLRPLLSSVSRSQQQPLQVWLLQSLESSLTAASQILISLSRYGMDYVWNLESQNTTSFPEGPFSVDVAALNRLSYAVDSTWISHTFAVTFLVLCYIRGTVDDDLRICSLIPNASLQTCAPFPPRSTSVIARLIRLALDIFDGVCRTPAFRPAGDFQAIVHNASSLVLAPDSNNGQEVDHSAVQSLLGLINDSGLEWPGSLLDSGADFTSGWGGDGMLGV